MSTDPTQLPVRRLAMATYSGLAVVGLVAVTLAGCGTPAAGTGATRLTASTARSAGQGEPPFATKAESRRLARRLLGKAVLPAGSTRFTGKLPAGLSSTSGGMSALSSVDVSKAFAQRWSARRTFNYLKKHHPAGWSQAGTGSTAHLVHGKQVWTAEQVSYVPKRLPADDFYIAMNLDVASGPHGHAVTRVDVQVIFYPRRSKAEHLTVSDVKAVTIVGQYANRHPQTVKRTFTQRAIINQLARAYNSEPASPDPDLSCPAILVQFELRFVPVPGKPATTVGLTGCYSESVSVDGHSQPNLAESGSFGKILLRLMPHASRLTSAGGPVSGPVR